MLYWLTALSDGGDAFNLFRYITFRAGGAFFTALIFGFLFGPPLINVLRRRQGKGQPIRADGPEGHFAKAGTPTMGGLLILLAVLSSTLLWARLDNGFVWIVLFVTFSFGLIGFADDYAKVSRQTAAGVPGKLRLALGFAISAIAAYLATSFHPDPLQYQIALPVFKNLLVNFSFFILTLCDAGDRRFGECGQSNRWARRACNYARYDRRRGAGRDRLRRWSGRFYHLS